MAFDYALILLAVGIICGIILIAMAFLGGMDVGADAGDVDGGADAGGGHGPSPFGLPTVLSVLSIFGLVGYLVTVWFGDLNIGLVAGLITGVCLGAIIFMFL